MTVYSKPALDLSVKRAVIAERERCAKIVEAEDELTDAMPDHLRLVPIEDLARAVVRATKKSIAAAIRGAE